MPIVKVNDINMYYDVYGEGEPLVLITGLGTDHTMCMSIITHLAQKYRVLAFDNRGVGRTDKPHSAYTIEMMSHDTCGLMDSLGIEQAHVMGISMGGRIALALALQYPTKAKSLILASTGTSTSKQISALTKGIKWIRSVIMPSSQPYYAFLRQLEASRIYHCSDRLGTIFMPTLILHGDKDQRFSYQAAEDMHAKIHGSQLVAFHGGHMFFFWQHDQFCNTILQFLSSSVS